MAAKTDMMNANLDATLAAYLRGMSSHEKRGWADRSEAEIADRIFYHGIHGLLADDARFASDNPSLQRDLFHLVVGDEVHEALNREVLRDVSEELEQAGIDALYLKGTALAYLVYDKPAHRPRTDTDILVPLEQAKAAQKKLAELGFEATNMADVHYQKAFVLTRGRYTFMIDLHWRAANSEVLSTAFEFDVLARNRQRLDNLHPAATAPSLDMMLSFAIMHLRFDTEYLSGDRLIWLQDLRGISEQMDEDGWKRFLTFQVENGLCGASFSVLSQAETTLGPFAPGWVLQELAAAPEGKRSAYLNASDFGRMRREISVRPPLSAIAFVKDVLFPSKDWLESQLGTIPRWQLPYIYIRRAIDGIAKAKRRSHR